MTKQEMYNKVCEIADLCEYSEVKTEETKKILSNAISIINEYN